MSLPNAFFPISVWNGLSATRTNFNNRAAAGVEESMQVLAELIAVENAILSPTVSTIAILNGGTTHNLEFASLGAFCLLQGELLSLEEQIDADDPIVTLTVAPDTAKNYFAMKDVSGTLSLVKLTLSDTGVLSCSTDLAVGDSLYLGSIWFVKE